MLPENAFIFSMAGAAVFCVGFYGLIMYRHLLRKILALNVMGSGVFLVLAALGRRTGGEPDPVPAALVITGIVVAIAATALALALMLKVRAHTGAAQLPSRERE